MKIKCICASNLHLIYLLFKRIIIPKREKKSLKDIGKKKSNVFGIEKYTIQVAKVLQNRDLVLKVVS